MPLQAMMTPKDQKNQYPKKPMPLKATMAKPIIQYPVYAVTSDDDTERSNQTSTLNAYALKSDDGENPEILNQRKYYFLKSRFENFKARKTQQTQNRTFYYTELF